MDEVTAEIKAVCVKLEEVEAEIKIKQARAEHNEVAALRKKEEQLRTKEEQLRAKELILLQRQPGALSSRVPRVHALTRVCLLADAHWAGSSNAGSERGSPPGALSALTLAPGLHVFLYTDAEKENAGKLAQAMGLGTALHADAPGVCTARARAL